MPESADYTVRPKRPFRSDISFIYRALCKKYTVRSSLALTVYAIFGRDKMRHTVSHTVIPEANPAIDAERFRIFIYIFQSYVASRIFGYARMGKNHSHSIVPGGLLV
jgi:hypothetical protein